MWTKSKIIIEPERMLKYHEKKNIWRKKKIFKTLLVRLDYRLIYRGRL